jgi:hypothetical protein
MDNVDLREIGGSQPLGRAVAFALRSSNGADVMLAQNVVFAIGAVGRIDSSTDPARSADTFADAFEGQAERPRVFAGGVDLILGRNVVWLKHQSDQWKA